MTSEQWTKAGTPDLGLAASLTEHHESFTFSIKPPWEMSKESEIAAISAFISLFPDPYVSYRNGKIVRYESGTDGTGQLTILRNRDEEFSKKWNHRYPSNLNTPEALETQVGIAEDAREAVIVGRKLGYRDDDILSYLIQNYIVLRMIHGADETYGSFLASRGYNVTTAERNEFFSRIAVPNAIKKLFPRLMNWDHF